jgi:hypothetical protein
MFLFGMSLYGAMFLMPLFEQVARGRTATEAGLLLAPQGLGLGIGMITIAPRANRLSARGMVAAGMLLTALGSIAYTQAGHNPSEWLLGTSLTVRGIGMAVAIIPTMTATYHGLRHDQIPRATTTSRILQQIGGSLGTAILAVILATQFSSHTGGGAGVITARGSDGGKLPGWVADAFGTTFWWPVIFTLLSVPLAFLIPVRLAGPEAGKPASAGSDAAALDAAPAPRTPAEQAPTAVVLD